MKIVFVSNYMNHHQIPFCTAMAAAEHVEFTFIQTERMEEERVRMGWEPDASSLPYMRYAYEEPEECHRLVQECGVVIWGGAQDETMLKPRLEAGAPVFRYSERLYKTGQWKAVSPNGLLRKYKDHTKYRKSRVYLLCAGAYVPSDFSIIRAYPGKMFKWGYFPEARQYDMDKLMAAKKSRRSVRLPDGGDGRTEILWAARFIDWKHPYLVVELAEYLAARRRDFHITMIGGGELEPGVRRAVEEKNLREYVGLAGYRTPREVRQAMEEADIYLVTSDRQEGWGAVLNEAMNSGCAVVADHMVGAAPYLIDHGKNGYLYVDGRKEEMFGLMEMLLDSPAKRERAGRQAYRTITEEWNAGEAAGRLLRLCRDIAEGKEPEIRWETGPCSRAGILREKKRLPERL